MSYEPKPLEVGSVELDAGLSDLLERLAKNTHETWANLRLEQGWTYGPQRDDAAKKHPCLIPYEELPESEKDYDRATASGVLKAILFLGCTVNTPGTPIQIEDADAEKLLIEDLRQHKNKLRLLRTMWEQRVLRTWSQIPKVYDALSEILCTKGEPFWAHDVASEGLRFFPGRIRLLQMQAWALAQSGATRSAEALLQSLHGAGHLDPETLGLLGRVYKDLAYASSGEKRTGFLKTARDYYAKGFELTPNSYNGINAATLSLLMSSTSAEKQVAHLLADQSAAACSREADGIWKEATLGEAALVKGQLVEAANHYSTFNGLAQNNLGAIQSARAQAKRILGKLELDLHLIQEWMPIPPIVLFAGHMVDTPERPSPRLPQEKCEEVKAQIRERLDRLDARIGYASAAPGGDILFLEAMQERDGEIHVILPCSVDAFREVSVRKIGGDEWVRRFDALLPHLSTLHVASQNEFRNSKVLYEFGSRILFGLSRIKSRIMDAPLHPLVLWDGYENESRQGTAADVRLWKKSGLDVEIIDLPKSPLPPAPRAQIAQNQQIKAVLFADVVGFSKLPEQDMPAYTKAFLGGVAQLLEGLAQPPLCKNTWGDAVYFVFDSALAAGECAMQLRDFVLGNDWLKCGLSRPINVRIGLHAGPVYPMHDAVTGMVCYSGTTVSRAARIEPISAEGQAYSSEAFAALTESEDVKSFSCHYVGEKVLPKKAGIIRVYQIERLVTQGAAVA